MVKNKKLKSSPEGYWSGPSLMKSKKLIGLTGIGIRDSTHLFISINIIIIIQLTWWFKNYKGKKM